MEDQKIWYEYWANISPWSPCFETKTFDEAVVLGCVMSTEHPSSMVAGACMAIRWPTEHLQHFKVFSYLANRKVDLNLACVMSHGLKMSDDVVNLNSEGWHCAMNLSYMGKNSWENFYEGRVVKGTQTYKNHLTYNDVHGCWGGSRKNSLYKILSSCFYNKSFSQQITTNPFANGRENKYDVNKISDLVPLSERFWKELTA